MADVVLQNANGITTEQMQAELRKIITVDKLEQYSTKTVRAMLEDSLNVPRSSLDDRKDEVKECVLALVKELQKETQATGADSNGSNQTESSEEDGDDSDGAAKHDGEANNASKKRKLDVHTEEPPRDIAKRQANLMTRDDFQNKAQAVLCTLGESKFAVEPRVFSANNKGQSNVGWGYYKKVKMPVGNTPVWCSVSMNIIVAGSRDWSEGKRKSKKG